MNTVKSVYYGWGTLIAAGGGAYYFAKRSINAERAAKAEADHKKRLAQYQLESAHFGKNQNKPPTASSNPSPSSSSVSTPLAPSATAELKKTLGKEAEDGDWHSRADEASNPSQEASQDPAPTRHAPEDDAQKMREKSKYEASDVYRSRKGDRFS